MTEIIGVRFKREGKQYYFDPAGLQVEPGQGVIVETSWGIEYGECVRGNSLVPECQLVTPLRPVLRMATPEDMEIVQQNRQKEKEAFVICQEKILDHELDMKLVDVEYSLEGNKILFFFTSEGRVDFRALVKDLAAIFHTRIELRQIGVRDEAKMLGGLGICGRPFCCASFLHEFQPVSIKMAKTQSLSLNPTKISGTCGRLMCCLKYEQEAYEDLLKGAPKVDSFVETPDGAGTIINANTLRELVRVRLDNQPDTLKTYHNCEICVVRSGKGKRPENYQEPSLEELAKLRRITTDPEEQLMLDQEIRTAVQEKQETSEAESETSHESESRKGNRRRRPERRKAELEEGLGSAGGGKSEMPVSHGGRNKKERKPEKDLSKGKPEDVTARPAGEEGKSNRVTRRSASKAAIEKALPQEKPAHNAETADKKNQNPHWHHRPYYNRPKKPKGQGESQS